MKKPLYPKPFHPKDEPTDLQKAMFKALAWRDGEFKLGSGLRRGKRNDEARQIAMQVYYALRNIKRRDTLRSLHYDVKYDPYYRAIIDENL